MGAVISQDLPILDNRRGFFLPEIRVEPRFSRFAKLRFDAFFSSY